MRRLAHIFINRHFCISQMPEGYPVSVRSVLPVYVCLFAIIAVMMPNFGYSQGKGGRWIFENSGEDVAGWDQANNSGTLQNQAVFSSDLPLQEGSAFLSLHDSLTHNYFRVEDHADLDFVDENVGISAWIYPTVLNDVHYILNKGEQKNNPKTSNYALRISQGSNNLEFLIRDANNQAQRVTSSFAIPLNQWTFVAAFYDFAVSKVYLWNSPTGDPLDTLDFSHNIISNNEPLAIGSWFRDDPVQPTIKDFKGRIDDVRISNKLIDIIPAASSVGPDASEIPGSFTLFQNYPNPFNPQTTIAFYLPVASVVRLDIFDNIGRHVETLHAASLPAGAHKFVWKATDATGNPLSSGVYIYRLTAGEYTQIRKMTLVR